MGHFHAHSLHFIDEGSGKLSDWLRVTHLVENRARLESRHLAFWASGSFRSFTESVAPCDTSTMHQEPRWLLVIGHDKTDTRPDTIGLSVSDQADLR